MIDSALEAALRNAWSSATYAGDNTWVRANPAAGHCDVTSLVVRERLGGDLLFAQVFRNGELSEHHYWNMLPDGTEVDLTKGQFDGTETLGPVTRMTPAYFAAAGPMQPALVRRLTLYRQAVEAGE